MRSRTHGGLALSAVLGCALSAACDSDFPPYNEVDGFRLLAIVADPPELAPGGEVTITALVVGDDDPQLVWRWCAVTNGPASAHVCAIGDDEIAAPLPAALLSTSTSATMRWPDDIGAVEALCTMAARREAPVDAPRLDCEGPRPEVYVRLEVTSAAGDHIVALHPLPLAAAGRPANTNPRIDDVRFARGAEMMPLRDDMALPAGETLDLEIAVPADAAEVFESAEGTTQEILRATWFVAGGEADAVRTVFIPDDDTATFDTLTRNEWTLPATPRDVALYLVLRDDRGGTSWIRRRATVDGGAP